MHRNSEIQSKGWLRLARRTTSDGCQTRKRRTSDWYYQLL